MVLSSSLSSLFFFFFNDTATTEIYTLSLHDALPICHRAFHLRPDDSGSEPRDDDRSEEHTSELQSRQYLVCRLLLEKKKKINQENMIDNKTKGYKNLRQHIKEK